MVAACAEVAHELGVPVLCPGLASDAKYGGVQAGYEKALKGLVTVSAGADLVTGGVGLLSGAGLMSLPQIVIDAEIAEMITRVVEGAEFSPATIMAEAIERVGFRGSYLSEKETSRRLRAGEVFQPQISTRLSIEGWRTRGRNEVDDAADRVRAILAEADARGPKLADDKAAALTADRRRRRRPCRRLESPASLAPPWLRRSAAAECRAGGATTAPGARRRRRRRGRPDRSTKKASRAPIASIAQPPKAGPRAAPPLQTTVHTPM